ncbi:MAG TPA: transporter substrate-binding domain-containing protein [Anaerolineales bacterium]|nr:transporter substrate-binding domain-containing protein [Anaerolineales bacterium]
MKKLYTVLAVIMAAAFVLSACGSAPTPAPPPTSAPVSQAAPTQVPPTAANTVVPDLLATIKARGTLVISTDPAYPPQSEIKASPVRTPGTKCTSDQKTLGEMEGFDIDVAAAIAKGLGVEPCWVTPDWTLIVAGNWAGRWDISVGSMTITPERAKALYFAQPYYTTPAAMFVYKANTTYASPADLSGKKIGVCGGCTYESFLENSLVLPGENINFVVKNAVVKTYDTDSTALADLELGDGVRLDAVITAQPTGQAEIQNGKPLKQLGDPLYYEYLAPAIDRSSSLDPHSFIAAVSQVVQGLHKDGTLSKLCVQWEGSDLTTAAATFDASQFGQ